jgi:tetratricopeptide (TPR) repeat protein
MKGHPQTRRTIALGAAAFALLLASLTSRAQSSSFTQSHSSTTSGSSLNDAKAKLTHGDLAGAETSLWTVLGSNPNDEEALTLLGVIRARQNRFAEAEALFRRALQINPQSLAAHRDLGNALAQEDKLDEALEQFAQAEALAPHDYQLKAQLAQLYAAKGQFSQALSTLQAIPPSHLPVEAIPVKAASLLAIGHATEAEPLIAQAKASPATQVDLAEVFLNSKLPDPALRCLAIAGESPKQRTARYYALKGKALQAKGETQAALRAFHEGLTLDPKSTDLLAASAELEAGQKNHAQALAGLKQAHANNPDSLPILRQLVVEAVRAGDQKTALDAASALSEKSSRPEDLYLAGAALLELNASGADTLLEKYVASQPKDPKGWLGLGIAYVQRKRYPDAQGALQHSLQLDPTSAEANYQLGLASKAEGNTQAAISYFQRAVELQPKHANALLTLGNLYLQTGDLQKGREVLERAETLDPNNLETEYDLGLILSKLGQSELAREHMDKYRKLKEASPPAEQEHK